MEIFWIGRIILNFLTQPIDLVNAQADEWRALEIARARKMLARGDDVDAVLEALSKGPDHRAGDNLQQVEMPLEAKSLPGL